MQIRPFRAWLSWGIAALFVFFQFALQSSTSMMIPCLEIAFHTQALGVAFLTSGFFYTYIIMQIPAGVLIDQYGAKKVISLGLIIAGFACLIFARSQHLGVAIFSRILLGLVCAPAYAGTLYVASNWFPPKQFALIVGLTELLAMLGGAVGESYLGYCVGGVGWRNTLFLSALFSFGLGLLAILLIQSRPRLKAREKTTLNFRIFRKQFTAVVKKSQSWFCGLFAGLVFTSVNAFAGLWAIPFLERSYHVPIEKAALISSMIYVGVGIGSPIMGLISDSIKRRKPIMLINTIIGIILVTLFIYIPHIPIYFLFILSFLLGISLSAYMLSFVIMREITPRIFRGTALGYTNMMSIIIGAPLLQLLICELLRWHWDGKIRKGIQVFSLENYHFALSVLPIALLLAIVVWFFIKETYCQEIKIEGSMNENAI